MKQRTPNQVTETRARVERWLAECEYTTEPIVRDELIWGVCANKENSPGIAVTQTAKYTDREFLQVAYVSEDGFNNRIALLAPDERGKSVSTNPHESALTLTRHRATVVPTTPKENNHEDPYEPSGPRAFGS